MTPFGGPRDEGSLSPRHLPLLTLLFVGSGCAALIYEIIWFQMISLTIGGTGLSLGVLLATFMGGMFLGSLALPRLVWGPTTRSVSIGAPGRDRRGAGTG